MALERDPDFVARMRKRFADVPNVEVIEGDVRNLPEILSQRGLESVDAVVSGLPIPSFPPELQQDVFENVSKVLKPGGPFSQITEMPWVYLRLYKKYFDNVRFKFEPRNIPPAGAYHCSGPKTHVSV
jgi:phospholipid N-methyltransferase